MSTVPKNSKSHIKRKRVIDKLISSERDITITAIC